MSDDPSVREAIESALNGAEGVAPATPESAAPAPAVPAPSAPPASAPPPASAGEPPPRGSAPEKAAVAGPKERSPFADQIPKFGEAPKPNGQTPPPAAPAPELKAPASWKADLRERWKTLTPDVQGEIIRRERENDARMQEHAKVKNFADKFHQIAAPYRAFMDAEGANPLEAFHDYLRTATMLRTGAPDDKARLVAQLVQQFAIPLPALDAYLAASLQGGPVPVQQPQQRPQPAQPQRPQEFRDPRLDALIEQMNARQGESLRTDIESFATDGKHEFFEDVRETMADVMDAGAKRGVQMSLEDAYVRACQIEPQVKKVLDERAARGNVGQAARTLAAARHAASSLPSQPAPAAPRNANAAPSSVREAILQSIDSLSNQA